MARTALVVQQHVDAGLEPVLTAANADGHQVAAVDDGDYLDVRTDDTPCNVTIVTPGSVNGLAITDRVVALGTDEEQRIPIGRKVYRQADGSVHVNFSAVTNVTCGAFRP